MEANISINMENGYEKSELENHFWAFIFMIFNYTIPPDIHKSQAENLVCTQEMLAHPNGTGLSDAQSKQVKHLFIYRCLTRKVE